ncbi:hypothetical protein [Clostridium sp. Marseille-P299]|uniref:hypothetical protein n=1 Tax=Clostridium sp. Marseille-P299 TaxID=1805477 RepID=UPI000831AB2B|nr:hypothetical protein [Clostridium sp. Marseille-P299]
MKLNGNEYKVPVIKSFMDAQKLEDQGIKILALIERSFFDPEKLATSVVKGISFYTGLPFDEALNEIDAHINNGGSIYELLDALIEDINSMEKIGALEGFSKGAKAPKVPQDRKKATKQ